MKLKVVALNETGHLRDGLPPIVGRYYGIYLFDAEEHTYCCELTPSHWLECVGFVTDNEISEEMRDELSEGLGDSSHYRHARGAWCGKAKDLKGDFDEFRDAVEYCCANSGYVEGLAMAGGGA